MKDKWTLRSLYDHFNRVIADLNVYIVQRFSDSDKAVQAALQAAKEAVAKAETAVDKRFNAQNEFREQLKDQAATFLPRAEYTLQYSSLEENLRASINRIDERINSISNSQAAGDGSKKGNDRLLSIGLSVLALLVSAGTIVAVIVVH